MRDAPVFVKIDKYKELLKVIREIQTNLENSKKTLDKLSSIKADEDAKIASWSDNLATIQNKLEEIETSFHEK